MKIIAALILLVSLMIQSGGRFLLMLNYELNKKYIAGNLCVNRKKPVNSCNGKCYLKKQLDKAAKEENAPKSSNRADKNEVLFLVSDEKLTAHLSAPCNTRQYLFYRQRFTSLVRYDAVFHPPGIV